MPGPGCPGTSAGPGAVRAGRRRTSIAWGASAGSSPGSMPCWRKIARSLSSSAYEVPRGQLEDIIRAVRRAARDADAEYKALPARREWARREAQASTREAGRPCQACPPGKSRPASTRSGRDPTGGRTAAPLPVLGRGCCLRSRSACHRTTWAELTVTLSLTTTYGRVVRVCRVLSSGLGAALAAAAGGCGVDPDRVVSTAHGLVGYCTNTARRAASSREPKAMETGTAPPNGPRPSI